MKIREVMEKPVFVDPSATRNEILKLVRRHPETDLFIVGSRNKKFKGAIHENDLFYMFLPDSSFEDVGIDLAMDIEKKFFSKNAKQIMREDDEYCYEDDDLNEVALRFARIEINEMAVLNKKKRPVGYISQRIILHHLKPQ